MSDQRSSGNEVSGRDIPSFIEPRPPLIHNPFMRPKPQKGTNLLELFEEDSELEEPELVQVYLRLKPCKIPNLLYEVRSDKCLVTSLDTATAGHGRRTQHNVSKMYTFSKIFGAECNQKQIFEQVVKDNLRKLPDGHNFTLLTYGASGSGKTYTLMGTVGAPGLVPRSLEYVFKLVDAAQQPVYKPAENGAEQLNYSEQDFELQWVKRLRHVSAPLRDKYRRMSVQLHSDFTVSSIDLSNRERHYVWVSFVEIYNEAVYDLLAPPDKRTKLRIREDQSGNVYVKGATQAFVRSGEEAYDVMVAGKHNLVVAATGVHAHSSRSHCIFTITMLTESGGAEGGVRTSYVRLCDLAGCERARATRNTGARMLESRAINSSLHVLERCLHMLRRKQRTRNDALVPYRESKLTRLLGSGLSGARGEAVSMVVTLNTSPEYAHETKHVLSLAAVAQDIQVNNTMMLSTLESSAQDTTVNCSNEVMKLRSDNERLHFELVQAQARNKELLASMEERQQEVANTMKELVEDAKDMTRQYYETLMESLRSEMDDMAEEYESRLAKLTEEVTQLMTERTVSEEKLSVERLARARAEKELEHLRTCIEERDEKTFKNTTPTEDVVDLSDSEHESDEDTSDPFNESLEPVFKREINKSLSKQNDSVSVHNNTVSVMTIDNIDEENEDVDNDTSANITEVSNSNNSTVVEDKKDNDESSKDNIVNDVNKCQKLSGNDSANSTYESTTNDSVLKDDVSVMIEEKTNNLSIHNDGTNKSVKNNSISRGTYFVKDNKLNESEITSKDSQEKIINSFRSTYFVSDHAPVAPKNAESSDRDVTVEHFKIPTIEKTDAIKAKQEAEKHANKIIKDVKSNHGINSSLTQFEQLEIQEKSMDSFRSTYFVSDHAPVAPKTAESSDKDLTVEHFKIPTIEKTDAITAKQVAEKHVNKIIKAVKSNHGINSSLTQFEQLEMASKEYYDNIPANRSSIFGNIKMLKEKRIYFDNEPSKLPNNTNTMSIKTPNAVKEKRTYFDNIDVNVDKSNKNVDFIKTTDDERSPSIVKENIICENFQLSEIKKLLGEKFTRPDLISSAQKSRVGEKYNSVDLFESPMTVANKKDDNDIEGTSQSIAMPVLQNSAKKDITPTPSQKVEILKSLNINGTVPSPMRADSIKSHIKQDIDKSPLRQDVIRSPIRLDIVKSPIKLDIAKSAIKLDFTKSSTNLNNTKFSVKNDAIILPMKNDVVESITTKDNAKSPTASSICFETLVKNSASKPMTIKSDIESITEFHAKDKEIKSELEIIAEKPQINKIKLGPESSLDEHNQTCLESNDTIKNNTVEEFENIYKNVTAVRPTEFELLVSESLNETIAKNHKEETKYNLRKKSSKSDDNKPDNSKVESSDEVLLESHAKCESKPRKRPLRLRRKRNQTDDSDDKLKDIVNLQTEFSDIIMGVPAPEKVVKDIPSPEKGSEENLNPIIGTQSCPAKSIPRSRRKLFTPRAEPLEESLSQTGDSNERIYVPRPSYHRTRARRKL